MNRKLSQSAIVKELAEYVCRRLTRKVISALKAMDNALLSGEDSGLRNTWEEICVQVQHEESIYWETYDETVRGFVLGEVAELPAYQREAVWLQTEEGWDWDTEGDQERESCPVNAENIVQYLLDQYIYVEAGRWTNRRIRRYLDGDD